jgi:Xaa-Pro aminopeptidase
MDKYGLDALVATLPENVYYISELWALSHWMIRGVQLYALFPRESDIEPTIIMPFIDADLLASNPSWIKDVRFHGTFHVEGPAGNIDLSNASRRLLELRKKGSGKNGVDTLVKTLKDKGLDNKRIGVDEKGIDSTQYDDLKRAMPKVDFTDAGDILREIRMIKTETETNYLREAALVNERAINESLSIAKAGITELELAERYESVLIKGHLRPFISTIVSGQRAAFGSGLPTSKKLERGDLVRYDVIGTYNNYWTDVTRTAVVGNPTERQKRYYDAVLAGEEKIFDTAKPGVKASELFERGVEEVRESGIPHYRRHHCGHAIGLECYERPFVAPTEQVSIEEGMILNVETPYYEIGFGGVQVEDPILITKSGAERLTKLERNLYII